MQYGTGMVSVHGTETDHRSMLIGLGIRPHGRRHRDPPQVDYEPFDCVRVIFESVIEHERWGPPTNGKNASKPGRQLSNSVHPERLPNSEIARTIGH